MLAVPSDVQRQSIGETLLAAEATEFVAAITKENYQEYYKGREDEVGNMVDRAWQLLMGRAGGSNADLHAVTAEISKEIFRKKDPEFWFNQDYQRRYKAEIKPRKDFEIVREHISGQRILDFGGGGGHFALILAEKGYRVCITDVLDYRVGDARKLSFRAMSTPRVIPFPADSFDTTMIKAVLHHIDGDGLSCLLDELRRVSRRVIVEEDIFGLPRTSREVLSLCRSQRYLKKYLEMSVDDQIRSLMLIDFFGNAITQGVPEMNMPFQFKTLRQWQSILECHGFKTVQAKVLGFQPYRINRPCQGLIVAERAT